MSDKNIGKDIKRMILRYLRRQSDESENAFIDTYYEFTDRLPTSDTALDEKDKEIMQSQIEQYLHAHIEKEKTSSKGIIRFLPRIAAAASILLIIGIAGYFYLIRRNYNHANQTENIAVAKDLAPGTNGAVLTLADGSKVQLDNAKSGSIINQGNVQLNKANDSMLVYKVNRNATYVGYNILETPMGKQYAVVLPDGSKVWLNAGSSLRYPTAFNGNERVVELTGEGYFQIIHNSSAPFKVKTGNQTIEDIGTEFNINAYSNEAAIKTTLINGAVNVVAFKKEKNLRMAGQQSILIGEDLSVRTVDIHTAVGWKYGLFSFDKADIKSVMRQFARWYNVSVKYEGKVPDVAITGDMYRNENASKALQILSYFNIKFRITDNKIIISQ